MEGCLSFWPTEPRGTRLLLLPAESTHALRGEGAFVAVTAAPHALDLFHGTEGTALGTAWVELRLRFGHEALLGGFRGCFGAEQGWIGGVGIVEHAGHRGGVYYGGRPLGEP